jgi:8-oxo-dGTP diphosphatase
MDSLKNISLIIVLFVMVAAIYWEVRLHWRRKIRQPFAFRPKKYMGATVFFLNNANQVLLLLRDNKKNIPFPNCWDALGGHVDPGETPLECIVREMKEEIDCQLESPTLFNIYDLDDRIDCIFWKRANFDIQKINLQEGQRLKWFTGQEISAMEDKQIAFGFKPILLEFFRKEPFKD